MGWYTAKQCATALGLHHTNLGYIRDLFPPSACILKRKYYTPNDVAQIRHYVNKNKPRDARKRLMASHYAAGWVSITQMGRTYGIARISLSKALASGRIPHPSHQRGSMKFYTLDESHEIATQFVMNRCPSGWFTTWSAAKELSKELPVTVSKVRYRCERDGIGILPTKSRRFISPKEFARLRELLICANDDDKIST